jgi:hypothetical protein
MRLQIFLLGVFFGLVETAHFGWNVTPKSDAEMICDGITVLIFAMSLLAPVKSSSENGRAG